MKEMTEMKEMRNVNEEMINEEYEEGDMEGDYSDCNHDSDRH